MLSPLNSDIRKSCIVPGKFSPDSHCATALCPTPKSSPNCFCVILSRCRISLILFILSPPCLSSALIISPKIINCNKNFPLKLPRFQAICCIKCPKRKRPGWSSRSVCVKEGMKMLFFDLQVFVGFDKSDYRVIISLVHCLIKRLYL